MVRRKSDSKFLGESGSPVVIAHRGCSDAAPENSMAAFQKAIEARADMIELDVRLSSDDHFIVFHDKRLERTSDGRGLLKNYRADELSLMDNGSWFSTKFSRERIPLLSNVFALTRRGVMLNIEIKPDVVSSNGASIIEILLGEIRRAKVGQKVIFTSFNHKMMKEAKRLDNSIVTGILYNPITNFRKSPSQLTSHAHADIFVCSKYQINHDVVSDAQKSGFGVYVYGVKTERDVKRMYHLGVHGIITNDPHFVRRQLNELR